MTKNNNTIPAFLKEGARIQLKSIATDSETGKNFTKHYQGVVINVTDDHTLIMFDDELFPSVVSSDKFNQISPA